MPLHLTCRALTVNRAYFLKVYCSYKESHCNVIAMFQHLAFHPCYPWAVWAPSQAGPLEINVMDTLDVSQDVLLSMVLMTKRKDDITKANKKRRGMLLMVGSSLPPCVMSLLQECSQCVMFYQTRGMKLTQSSQVRGIQVPKKETNRGVDLLCGWCIDRYPL